MVKSNNGGSMSDTFKVAAIQMLSEPSVAANLAAARRLIAEAARQGARLASVPEYFCIFGMRERDKVEVRERDGSGPIQQFLSDIAREFGLWIVGGSVPLESSDPGKVRNSCLVYDDRGERVARYDKIHLFGFATETERYQESVTIEPGTAPVAIDTPFGRMALSICYDLRFPELYRSLAPMDIILVPSAFTATTGAPHWEILLRARAIENLAYVVAPAQGGRHVNGRHTHGHSMIVDPWGKVLGCLPDGPGVVVAEIDPAYRATRRASLPALEHRVL
ncbi:MAG: acyltransferase [Betaproteobacteria bacterium RIFCSPLOWO2_12_FULL_65_110]|nr:MAG: acyltransferase [Betaproteobacteria bacterium RIFCSPLOWO2_12_FULL_65_110]